jgi:hypothetical protein
VAFDLLADLGERFTTEREDMVPKLALPGRSAVAAIPFGDFDGLREPLVYRGPLLRIVENFSPIFGQHGAASNHSPRQAMITQPNADAYTRRAKRTLDVEWA